jgi:hypothetical protein
VNANSFKERETQFTTILTLTRKSISKCRPIVQCKWKFGCSETFKFVIMVDSGNNSNNNGNISTGIITIYNIFTFSRSKRFWLAQSSVTQLSMQESDTLTHELNCTAPFAYKFALSKYDKRSRVSSGSIVSDYGLDDRAIGVRSPAGAKDCSSSLCPDRLWSPPSLLSNGYRGSFPRE